MNDRWSLSEKGSKYHLYGNPEGYSLCNRYLKLWGIQGLDEKYVPDGIKCKSCLNMRKIREMNRK
jgi:hypothetical protein